MSFIKICSIPDCGERCKAKGLCGVHYYRQRDLARAIKSAAGQRCHYCRKPSDGKYTCLACTKKKSEFARLKRDQAVARGLCVYSGCSETPAPGKKLCKIHQRKSDRYYQDHKGEHSSALTPEVRTVRQHLSWIKTGLSTYAGMPFHDAWNSAKGGTADAGERWIVQNLGRRPSPTHQLHIVDRQLGFVPGNLQWVPRDQHKRQEMIYKLLLEVQTLKTRYESA